MAIKSIKMTGFGGGGLTFGDTGTMENWTATYQVCYEGCTLDPRCLIELAINFADEESDQFPQAFELWPPVPFESNAGCTCLLYTSPSPRDQRGSRMPSSA